MVDPLYLSQEILAHNRLLVLIILVNLTEIYLIPLL
jgi:hypothetical protein